MNLTKAIITAMKEEAELIIKKFNLKETKSLKNIKTLSQVILEIN